LDYSNKSSNSSGNSHKKLSINGLNKLFSPGFSNNQSVKSKRCITGFVRSGNTDTANGASEILKEIAANIKMDDLRIWFRMDSSYFNGDIY